jgi:hypothetical protein
MTMARHRLLTAEIATTEELLDLPHAADNEQWWDSIILVPFDEADDREPAFTRFSLIGCIDKMRGGELVVLPTAKLSAPSIVRFKPREMVKLDILDASKCVRIGMMNHRVRADRQIGLDTDIEIQPLVEYKKPVTW